MRIRAAIRTVGWAVGLTSVAVGAAVTAASPAGKAAPVNDLVLHEWGTFLSMQGADGVTLDGMYHEEHALPSFVHARSREQLRLPAILTKGETPVIYFYTGRRQKVTVEVGFPKGTWTQWYPQASALTPNAVGPATLGAAPQGTGRIRWQADVIPAESGPAPKLPPVEGDALWRYSRQVDAAYVRTQHTTKTGPRDEYERFLFYRGLGTNPLPLQWTESQGGTLSVTGPRDASGAANSWDGSLRHLFILRVENGRAVYRYVPELRPGQELTEMLPTMSAARPVAEVTQRISNELAGKLTESGLYGKEARAMVNTWKTSYFQSEGTRVLYVLPQAWTDRYIPLTASPKPVETVRVMVGRLELLTGDREARAVNAVRNLLASDAANQAKGFLELRSQGRFVEPILRRTARNTPDDRLRTACERLLQTRFVTDLRAPAYSALDGSSQAETAQETRRQLNRLLAEVRSARITSASGTPGSAGRATSSPCDTPIR